MTDSGGRNAGSHDDSRGPVIFGAILFVIVIAVAVYYAVSRPGDPVSNSASHNNSAAKNSP